MSETSEALTLQEDAETAETKAPMDGDSEPKGPLEVGDGEVETAAGEAKRPDSESEKTSEPKEKPSLRFGDYDDHFPPMMAPKTKRPVPQAAHTRVKAWAYTEKKTYKSKGGMVGISCAHGSAASSAAALTHMVGTSR